jgi:hypothetical protein
MVLYFLVKTREKEVFEDKNLLKREVFRLTYSLRI